MSNESQHRNMFQPCSGIGNRCLRSPHAVKMRPLFSIIQNACLIGRCRDCQANAFSRLANSPIRQQLLRRPQRNRNRSVPQPFHFVPFEKRETGGFRLKKINNLENHVLEGFGPACFCKILTMLVRLTALFRRRSMALKERPCLRRVRTCFSISGVTT